MNLLIVLAFIGILIAILTVIKSLDVRPITLDQTTEEANVIIGEHGTKMFCLSVTIMTIPIYVIAFAKETPLEKIFFLLMVVAFNFILFLVCLISELKPKVYFKKYQKRIGYDENVKLVRVNRVY